MKIVEDMTIGKMLSAVVRQHPKKNAVEYLGQYWTYEELDEVTDSIALEMLHMGIRKGTKVGIWANDRPNTLFCFLALEKIGGIPVMLNTSWTVNEVQSQIERTDVEYLFYDEGYKELDFVKICEEINTSLLKKKIYIGQKLVEKVEYIRALYQMDAVTQCQKENKVEFGEKQEIFCRNELEQIKCSIQPTDTDVILFTSGSTSMPKGVVTTHFSRVNNVYAQAEMVKASCEDVFCVAIPMFHCFSLSGNVLAALAVGGCICFPQSRKTDHIYEAIERAGCTILTAVPTLYSAMLANIRRDQYDIATLRTGLVGGAGCSKELFVRIYEELHMDLLPSLGQTEATAGITAGSYEDDLEIRMTSAGYLLEHLEGRIVNVNTGEPCSEGENGELCIRGYCVMQGYYKQPELTSQTIDEEGFLHTGDMGYFDAQGRLYLTGRLKELIIRGGENIAPAELEEVIRTDERVAEVKVVGVPDAHYGEEVCACVVLKGTQSDLDENKEADVIVPDEIKKDNAVETSVAQELRQQIGKQLAAYKMPRYIIFLKKLPLTGNGKIDLTAVKQIAKEKCI